MHERTIHKELHDPFAHYLRGVLLSDGDTFTFIAHRQPYSGLDSMSWTTEQAFMADYRRMIDQKYSL